MKHIILLAALSLFTAATQAQTWKALPGTEPYVHRIKVFSSPDALVVCGDSAPPLYEDANANMEYYSGMGYRISSNDGGTWSDPVLKGYSVRDILRLPADSRYWIAAVIKPFSFTGGLVRSTNAGEEWSTQPENDLMKIEQFLVRAYDPPLIMTAQVNTSDGFQTSTDSCKTLVRPGNEPVSTRSIAISEADTALVFMAGDGRGLPGVLWSRDNGVTWSKDSIGLEGKRVLCVWPSRFHSNVVYCGTDSIVGTSSVGTGMFKSNDTGRTWFRLKGTENTRIWRILEHPTWGSALLAAADTRGILVSDNWGDGWEQWNDGLPQDVIVRTVELTRDQLPTGKMAAYCGTYGHGVFKSGIITTGVNEDDGKSVAGVSIAPNPVVDVASIVVATDDAGEIGLELYDVTGRMLMTARPSQRDGRAVRFQIDTRMLPSGAYRIVVRTTSTIHTASLLH